MPNKNYRRSYSRERQVKLEGEKQGYYTIRSSGSHGVADVIWIKPLPTAKYGFEVRFIQIKVSEHLQKKTIEKRVEETPFGPVEVEYWLFPVRKR